MAKAKRQRKKVQVKTTMRGRMSHADYEYIRSHASTMTVEAIAQVLNKKPEAIQTYINTWVPPTKPETGNKDDEEKWEIKTELRNSEMFKNLKKEFDSGELLFFEEIYIKLMSQFRGDVLATEESDIFHVAKYEILMHRNLVERKDGVKEKERLEKKQREMFLNVASHEDIDENQTKFATMLEQQIASLESGLGSKTSEYVKLQKCRDDLMTRLKATRSMRVKDFENSKISFLGVIKHLQEKDVQQTEGKEAALMKLAGAAAYDTLGHATQYEDGNWDNPILSADTVDFGPLPEDEDDPLAASPADDDDS